MSRKIKRSDDLRRRYRTEQSHGDREGTLRSAAIRKGERAHDGSPSLTDPAGKCQSLHRRSLCQSNKRIPCRSFVKELDGESYEQAQLFALS